MNIAFTIATANYLAEAKTVGDSYLLHNPNDTFIIYLFDKINNRFSTDYFDPIKIVEIDVNLIQDFETRAANYNIFELTTSIRPFVALQVLDNCSNISKFFYLDCDIKVYNSFSIADDLLNEYDILISPHFISPIPADGYLLDEKSFFNSGFFNSGFFAFNRSPEAIAFLEWWNEKLKTQCIIDFCQGLFADQIWLNLVPHYFKKVKIIKDLGYNVAYWNLHERFLTNQNNEYWINEKFPLVFFHYSGFNVNEIQVLSKFQNRYTFENKSEVLPFFTDYSKSVLANNHQKFSFLECFYLNKTKIEVPPVRLSFMTRLKSKVKSHFCI
ncbi:MAG: hypothetical protein ACRYFA_10740 [Janthinobacterium lividum]